MTAQRDLPAVVRRAAVDVLGVDAAREARYVRAPAGTRDVVEIARERVAQLAPSPPLDALAGPMGLSERILCTLREYRLGSDSCRIGSTVIDGVTTVLFVHPGRPSRSPHGHAPHEQAVLVEEHRGAVYDEQREAQGGPGGDEVG